MTFSTEKEQNNLAPQPFRITRPSYALLLVLLVIWPLGTGLLQSQNIDHLQKLMTSPVLEVYLPTMIIQLLVFTVVLFVVRHESAGFGSMGYDRFSLDKIMTGLAFFVGAQILLIALSLGLVAIGFEDFRNPAFLLPESTSEKMAWAVLAFIVAFAEETAFRGYALTRLDKLFGNRTVAILVASISFSLGHIYQGFGGVIVIFVYSLMFSILFFKTGSIWPCIVAHFLQDITPILALEALKDFQ